MNRRLLLLLPKTDSVGYGVVGYAGVDLAVNNDMTGRGVWQRAAELFATPTPLVMRGDTVTFKRSLPFRFAAAVEDDRNRGLSMSEIVERARSMLVSEQMWMPQGMINERIKDQIRLMSLDTYQFFIDHPVARQNKLLLKRKKS